MESVEGDIGCFEDNAPRILAWSARGIWHTATWTMSRLQ